MYSSVSIILIAPNPAATRSESIATGPTANCLEVPRKAYTTWGARAAYNPYTGGKPAIKAYAIPCGISKTATVTPAKKSPLKYSDL